MDLSILLGVIVVDERGQEARCAGMRKGVSDRLFKFDVKGLPFLKKGGGRCRILLRSRREDDIVIVVEWFDNSGGVGFCFFCGREFA